RGRAGRAARRERRHLRGRRAGLQGHHAARSRARSHTVVRRVMLRVGSGVDVHAFAEGVPLWLGGILIPHSRGLVGHSDGDAAVHALIDALLGAAGRGDIGEWFPSSDERWRGARSTEMLRHVWTALHADGWRLENVDVTLIASEPRLAPYRYQMRQALADALG